MTALYQLTTAYAQLAEMVDNPEADDQQIAAWLEECQGELRDKATNIVMLVQNLEATADAIDNAEKRMADRRKVIENRAKSIKAYVLRAMQAANITKIECPEFRISVRNNPPRVVIDDENAIPIAYLRQPEPPPPAPDKKAILADIKQGVIVDGAHIEIGQSLAIS